MLKRLAPLALLVALVTPALAQESDLGSPKTYAEQPTPVKKAIRPEVQLSANQLQWSLARDKVNGHLVVDVVLSTLNKFHLYEDRTSFRLADSHQNQWEITVVEKPPTTQFFDPVSKRLVPGYVGQALFRLHLKPTSTSAAHGAEMEGVPFIAQFQACSDTICLFPTNLLLSVTLSAPAKTTEPGAGVSVFSQSGLQSLISNQLGQSSWAYLILLLAGILTAFTPCVYPMYPITIGIFSRWASENSTSPFQLSFLYALGITLSYAALGLITAATGTVFGSLTQSPWFLIGIGSLLLASAVLFSGFIEFSLPTKLINAVSSPNSKLGPHTQSLLFGATLGIVASPCVGPVLIAVLSWTSAVIAAQSFDAYFLGFTYLSAFGLGMSLPFLVMSQMILRFKASPSFGRWTPWIKRIGTLLLLASSMYFLIPGLRFLSVQYSLSESATTPLPIKTYSVFDAPTGKPWLIDFRADWCVACLEIEAKTLRDNKVIEHFETQQKTALVKVDLTVLNDDNQQIAKKYGVLSLPALIFVNPRGEICSQLSTFEFIEPTKLLEKLNDPCLR